MVYNEQLQLANGKTEIILLTDMRISKVIDIKVGNHNLKTKNVIKYLGI
jgi:hypothetical protein